MSLFDGKDVNIKMTPIYLYQSKHLFVILDIEDISIIKRIKVYSFYF